MLKLHEMRRKAIVTTQQGSWLWQQPYRVNTYRPRLAANGKVLWTTWSIGPKRSWPQLERAGFTCDMDIRRGSLHNKPVTRREALLAMGSARVRSIEKRGWRFA